MRFLKTLIFFIILFNSLHLTAFENTAPAAKAGDFNFSFMERYAAAAQKPKSSVSAKITLTPKRTAAVTLSITGGVLLLAVAGLLAGFYDGNTDSKNISHYVRAIRVF
jgi:hypothetical protein